jgi:hypothetical protein
MNNAVNTPVNCRSQETKSETNLTQLFRAMLGLVVCAVAAVPALNDAQAFADFKVQFEKIYGDAAEEQARFLVFSYNLRKAEARNNAEVRKPPEPSPAAARAWA